MDVYKSYIEQLEKKINNLTQENEELLPDQLKGL